MCEGAAIECYIKTLKSSLLFHSMEASTIVYFSDTLRLSTYMFRMAIGRRVTRGRHFPSDRDTIMRTASLIFYVVVDNQVSSYDFTHSYCRMVSLVKAAV